MERKNATIALYFLKNNALEGNAVKAVTRLTFLDDAGEKFFGEGPCRLLKAVEETGSLRSAAASMGMAYTKALRILKQAETALGFPLTERTTGGRDGGGSRLTMEGKRWLQTYEACRDACREANEALFHRFFPKTGCVIMASGLGKRFGSNKLMAPFLGKPMILWALDATQGLFHRRVVVTRHEEVAALCRQRGVEAVLHDRPHRSDTVRLGLEAVGDVDVCCFCPGDQPLLKRETVAALAEAWKADREMIWRTEAEAGPGMPVLFPRWTFPQLLSLPEGAGGGYVLRQHPDRVKTVKASACELMDADTPEALKFLEEAGKP